MQRVHQDITEDISQSP